MHSSRQSAVSTSGDDAVVLMSSAYVSQITILNEGTAPGFFSIDGGSNWCRIPAGPVSITIGGRNERQQRDPLTIHVKRVAGGTDMSGLYAFGW